jgi:hypothetical protein
MKTNIQRANRSDMSRRIEHQLRQVERREDRKRERAFVEQELAKRTQAQGSVKSAPASGIKGLAVRSGLGVRDLMMIAMALGGGQGVGSPKKPGFPR